MLFDVIYVNYNSTSFLIRSIESLIKEDKVKKKLNFIVVDNFSGDNAHQLKDVFPEITIVFNKKNRGFSCANNQALTYCRSKYIMLLNPDSLADKGFLENCYQFMEQNPKTGIMGPKILNEDCSIQGSARSFPTSLTALFGRNSPITIMSPNNAITRSNVLNLHNTNLPREVDWVSGACMIVRRKAIEDVGLLDERFFMYWEDADWCRRMREKGWKIVYFPQAVIYHHTGKSSESRPFRSIYHFHKSAYRLHEKYTKFPLSLLNPLVLVLLAFRGIIAGVIRMAKKKKSIH